MARLWKASDSYGALKLASLEAIREAAGDGSMVSLVWGDEGAFSGENFKFTGNDKPLLVDIVTANALMTVYNALTEQEQKDKVARMIAANRNSFVRVVDFVWKVVK